MPIPCVVCGCCCALAQWSPVTEVFGQNVNYLLFGSLQKFLSLFSHIPVAPSLRVFADVFLSMQASLCL